MDVNADRCGYADFAAERNGTACIGNGGHLSEGGGLIVTAAALAVSAVTCLLLPALGIYGLEIRFGILHMFGLSMLLYGLFTCKKRWIPALTGAVLFCLWLAVVVCPGSAYSETVLIAVGITPDGFYSADYYPLLPYFFLYLAGTFIGPAVKEGKFPRWFYAARLKPIEWVGRNSLLIYLLHQVILFGIIYGIFTLITL